MSENAPSPEPGSAAPEPMTVQDATAHIGNILKGTDGDAGEPEPTEHRSEESLEPEPELELEGEEEPQAEADPRGPVDSVEGDAEPQEPAPAPEVLEGTVAELAEAMEIAPEELAANFKTTVQINGEPVEVSLKELGEGYQRQSDYSTKLNELASEREQHNTISGQAETLLLERLQQTDGLIHTLRSMNVNQMSAEALADLSRTDPAEYVAVKHEIDARNAQIDGIAAQHAQQVRQYQDHLARKSEIARQDAQRTLRTRMPEMADDDSAMKFEADVFDRFPNAFGFTRPELEGFMGSFEDHKYVLVMGAALKYLQMEEGGKKARRVAKGAKGMKPGAQRAAAGGKTAKLGQLRSRLSKSSAGSLQERSAGVELVRSILRS